MKSAQHAGGVQITTWDAMSILSSAGVGFHCPFTSVTAHTIDLAGGFE
jgi:hypothetical protein